MVIHVKDEETDALVRELAQRRKIGITAAIRTAVEEALVRESPRNSLWASTEDLRTKLNSYPRTGETLDKRFFDSLSGQEGDD